MAKKFCLIILHLDGITISEVGSEEHAQHVVDETPSDYHGWAVYEKKDLPPQLLDLYKVPR